MKRGDYINLDEKIKGCIPPGVVVRAEKYNYIEEIRLRENCPLCFTVKGVNYVTDYTVTRQDIEYSVSRFCKNSMYSYIEKIKKGYIPFDDGYRIGVCGTAVTDDGAIKNISDITSLNIRIPSERQYIPPEVLKGIPYQKSLMVYSVPNGGKTTFLRHMAVYLATPPLNKRVSVLDPKKELYSKKIHNNIPIDFFVGYPKYKAMDMAIRNMAPEVIICDEIGIEDEITAFVECKNCGIGLICSAHASTLEELLMREKIRRMHELNVFDGYLGIELENGARKYKYTHRKDINN